MCNVSINKTDNYQNLTGKIYDIFELHGGLRQFISRGDKVLLKPNLLVPRKSPLDPVITDPRMILAVAEVLKDYGARLSLGDSPAFSTVKTILSKCGIYNRLLEMDVNVLEFNRPGNKWKSLTLDKALEEHDKLINLPKLKPHRQLMVTLSVKNLFGCVSGKRKALLHMSYGDKDNDFAEMLVGIYQKLKPAFTLVDAIEAMNKTGPRGGEMKHVGLIFAGVDCVAIDRVICESMNLDSNEYRILRAARDLDAGEWRFEKINLLGEKRIVPVSLELPQNICISFSPYRVLKSTIKNMIIKRRQNKTR
ncbi:MAG: DUF362 domain-containing protein [Spirochaetota bacterium]|nr:DUF362 domain-containing protein [Spirochaetota bacterium]